MERVGVGDLGRPGRRRSADRLARNVADGLGRSSLTGAGYGNYAPIDETAERVRAGFGDERFERLRRVNARHDPDNVFRFNHNIPPAEAG